MEKHGRRGPSSSNSNNKKKNFGRKDTPVSTYIKLVLCFTKDFINNYNFSLQFIGQLIEHKPIVERVRGEKLETSALGLTFRIKPKYVKQGLKLECTASIGSVYWQSFLETPKVSPKEQISIYGNLWGSSDANGKMFNVFFFKNIYTYIFKLLLPFFKLKKFKLFFVKVTHSLTLGNLPGIRLIHHRFISAGYERVDARLFRPASDLERVQPRPFLPSRPFNRILSSPPDRYIPCCCNSTFLLYYITRRRSILHSLFYIFIHN